MTGAKQLDPGNLSGTILLNLDTEEDDELTIGCAGGIDTNTIYSYKQVPVAANGIAYQVSITGLLGGHSGMDIHKGRANANKLMNRFLFNGLKAFDLNLSSVDGGSLRNAIPRESTSIVVIPSDQEQDFKRFIADFTDLIKKEFQAVEQSLSITAVTVACPAHVVAHDDAAKIVQAIYALPNGVFRMSPDIDDLVEASSNLARVIVKGGDFITQSLQRSSVESTKLDVAYAVAAPFELMGCNVSRSGDYPGWKPNADSDILRLMTNLYQEIFREAPKVNACHAGLECGILGAHLPGMDMISFGPTIHGAHSPDEKVKVPSVQKFWGYLVKVLAAIPVNK